MWSFGAWFLFLGAATLFPREMFSPPPSFANTTQAEVSFDGRGEFKSGNKYLSANVNGVFFGKVLSWGGVNDVPIGEKLKIRYYSYKNSYSEKIIVPAFIEEKRVYFDNDSYGLYVSTWWESMYWRLGLIASLVLIGVFFLFLSKKKTYPASN